MAFYPQLVLDALKHVRYPGTGEDIVSAGMVDDNIRIDGKKISFSLLLEKPNDPFAKSLVKASEQAIITYIGDGVEIKGNIDVMSVDVSILNGYVDSTTKILDARFAGQHYGAAVRNENASLISYINKAITQ